ncbi:MAG: protease modulator HflC [Sphingomonadales bacterium]
MSGRMIGLLAALGVLAVLAGMSLFQVHETQQAIVLEFGNPKRTHSEPGLKVKLPWQNVIFLERRILNLDIEPQEVIASDQKRVVVDAFARFRVVDPLRVYQRVTDENGVRNRLSTLVRSQLREVLARESFALMLSAQRADLMAQIAQGANQAANELGAEVIDVRIKRADLPTANSQAIYQRMQTEREQEAREIRATGQEEALGIRANADRDRTVILAEARRQSEVLRGEGDGEAVRIFAEAFGKDEEFFAFYRSMQAYQAALGQEDTTMILSPDSEFFRFFGGDLGNNR